MKEWQIHTRSAGQTGNLGLRLGGLIEKPIQIWLSGDLGAGKTCFTKGLALGLGIGEDEPVTSPSYTLLNNYRGRLDLFHFDLYRLVDPDDLHDLGFDEYLRGDGVTVVEWADRFGDVEEDGLMIGLAYLDEDSRSLSFRAQGEEGEALLAELARTWREDE